MKIYSIVIKGQRIDISEDMVNELKQDIKKSEKVVMFTKKGKIEVDKATFDAIIAKIKKNDEDSSAVGDTSGSSNSDFGGASGSDSGHT